MKFGIRWYNPTTGTWTQQDTLDSPLDPHNANRYAYAANDPINNTDPAGQTVFNDIAGLGVGLAVGLTCEVASLGIGSFGCAVIGAVVGYGYSSTLKYLEYGDTPALM